MQAPVQPDPARGSTSSYVSGTFSFLDPLDEFIEFMDESFGEAVEDALSQARDEVREFALKHPAWKDYADLLDVEYVDGEIHYVLVGNDERVQEALALEYGGPTSGPQSLIRKLATRQAHTIGKDITATLSREVPVG